jgi:GTP cyclohydrolase I
MSKSCREIVNLIANKYPLSLAESYDNVGLILGNPETRINKILVCLDINDSIADYAINNKIDMIVSHHPILFKAIKKIAVDNYSNKLICKLISNNISVYALHTNFDNAEDGMNDILATIIGINNINKLVNEKGTGRFGELSETISLEQLCIQVKAKLNIESLQFIGDPLAKIKNVAIVGGSGADFINDAIDAKCEVIITGDVKYHSAVDALYAGINVIDAGHYNTEAAVMPYLTDIIGKMTGIEVICSPFNTNPIKFI